MGIDSSTRSYVVNLFPQDSHWRRRRVLSPSSDSRESMTAVSSALQYGHFMSRPLASDRRDARAGFFPVYRMPAAQLGHGGGHALPDLLVLRRLEHIGEQVAELDGFRIAETARGHRRRAD